MILGSVYPVDQLGKYVNGVKQYPPPPPTPTSLDRFNLVRTLLKDTTTTMPSVVEQFDSQLDTLKPKVLRLLDSWNSENAWCVVWPPCAYAPLNL